MEDTPVKFLNSVINDCVDKQFSGELLIEFVGGLPTKFKKTRVFKYRKSFEPNEIKEKENADKEAQDKK